MHARVLVVGFRSVAHVWLRGTQATSNKNEHYVIGVLDTTFRQVRRGLAMFEVRMVVQGAESSER